MKRKYVILFGAVVIALLMASTPLIPALETIPKTTTIVQQPTSTIPTINSKAEAIATLINIKMLTSDPKLQALASEGIILLTSGQLYCKILAVYLVSLVAIIAYAALQCDEGNLGFCVMVVLYTALYGYLYGVYVSIGCSEIIPPNPTTAQNIVTNCPICVQ